MRVFEQSDDGGPAGGGLTLVLILLAITGVALGLSLVWINIERMNLGYVVKRLSGEVEARAVHTDKLEVERDRLISPYILEQKARELGMRGARSGQTRRMDSATQGAKK